MHRVQIADELIFFKIYQKYVVKKKTEKMFLFLFLLCNIFCLISTQYNQQEKKYANAYKFKPY